MANDQFDLIVVGGGIYGACLVLESARRGLRPLLLERDDFGGGTSWNSLRIVHGGLRYLQHLDLARYRLSASEQAWWLNQFPDQVQPLSCLLPLYNRGLRSTHLMRAALWMNNHLGALVRRQSFGDRASSCLPNGQV
ncbi:MAG: FAD-dependent oxidoreductase, partial [Pseudomonadales bacterium]